jgi:hypothetical protein
MDKINNLILQPIAEIHRLMPDSLLFGALLMYILTQNFSFAIFAVFVVETIASHRFLSWMFEQSVEQSKSNTGLSGSSMGCRAGYKIPRFDPERAMTHTQYPSYAVFSVTSIGTYLGLATSEFSSTMAAMGPEWSSRATVAYSFIVLFLIIVVLSRLLVAECDSGKEIMYAMGAAIVAGSIFFTINKAVFGKEAMNFLGLPYMVTKESQGAPIYVCSTDAK